MIRPRAAFMPAHNAADWPQLKANRCARTRGSAAASSLRISQDWSRLQSSVMMISKGAWSGSTVPHIAAMSARKFPSSLKQGMTRLSSGFSLVGIYF